MLAKLQKLKNKKGFTLVELIVVIAIIAILAAVLIPVIGNYVNDARESADAQTLKAIEESLGVEVSEMGNLGVKLKLATAGVAGTITFAVTDPAAGSELKSVTVTLTGVSVDTSKATDATYNEAKFKTNMQMRLGKVDNGKYTVQINDLNGDPVVGVVKKEAATPAST